MDTTTATEFIYVGDTMCSWCWGFAPTLEALPDHFAIPIRVVNGGLRPGPNAQKLDDQMRSMLEHHWAQVRARSGQPFDTEFIQRTDGWVYDTELPAMAVVTMRDLAPDETLRFFTRLQRGFYAEGTDLTDPTAYPGLLDGFDVDTEAFLQRFATEETRWKTWEDFEEAQSMGIMGFPSLLLRLGERLAIVTRGYAPIERLAPGIEKFLRGRLGDEADGLVCSIDGNC